MPEAGLLSRQEIYRLIAETKGHLRTCRAIGQNPQFPFNLRYEATVVADTALEALADLDELLKLTPEA